MFNTRAALANKKNVPQDKNSPPPKRGDEPDLNTMVKDSVVAALQSADVAKLVTQVLVDSVTKAVLAQLEKTLKFDPEALNKMEQEIKEKDKKIAELETEMRRRTDDLEQYQRRANLRIFGVPESKNRNQREDPDAVAINVFNKQLGLSITPADIDRCHRVGAPKEGKPRPLIVKFVSYRKRAEVFRCKRQLKGTGVTIREDLAPIRLQELQKAIKKYGLKNVWTEDGKIVYINQGKKEYATRIIE